jgi:hypothetical protein
MKYMQHPGGTDMKLRIARFVAFALIVVAASFAVVGGTPVRPVAQASQGSSGQMMGSQHMAMEQMAGQMQHQMDEMGMNLKSMRAQIDKISPGLLTEQESAMYEYLKLLQLHMEAMQGWMGMAQGAMRQMGGPKR